METSKAKPGRRVAVSDGNLKKAALRLLNQSLVSTEINYIKHVLGATAPQTVIDEKVVEVRRMPWESIVLPD